MARKPPNNGRGGCPVPTDRSGNGQYGQAGNFQGAEPLQVQGSPYRLSNHDKINRVLELYDYVHFFNISEVVTAIETLELRSLNNKDVKWLFGRVIQTAEKLNPEEQYVHCFYLVVVVGHLQLKPWLLSDRRTKECFDCLLCGLQTFSRFRDKRFFYFKFLEDIAPVLVERSSCNGWLALAASFYPYLGPQFVVAIIDKIPNILRTYSRKVFPIYADLLLSYITIDNSQKKPVYRELLKAIVRSAPTVKDVLESLISKFDNIFSNFFDSKEKEELFSGVGKRRSKKGNSSVEKLSDLVVKISDENFWQDHKNVHKALLEFIKAVNKKPNENIDAFIQLISDTHMIPDEVNSILLEMCANDQNLLCNLLCEKIFENNWKKITPTDKINVLTRFIRNIVKETNQAESKTGKAYEAVERVISFPLINQDEDLAKMLCKSVSEKILKDESGKRILEAFKDVEKLSLVVQANYKEQVKAVLKQNTRLIKHSSEVLEQWRHSSYGQSLLSCVLDSMEVPKDVCFKKMIELCDIWVILLNANEHLKTHETFVAGRDYWQDLEKRISEGSVSPNFLEDEIKKHKDKLSQISAVLSSKADDNDKQKKDFLDRVTNLLEKDKHLSNQFNLLETVINYVKKELKDLHGESDTLVNEFSKRKKSWRTRNLNELDDVFWGPLFPLLESGKILEPLIESISFKKYLTNPTTSLDDEDVPHDVYEKIHLLICKGIKEFKESWYCVFSDPNSLSFDTMEILLGSLKSKEKLEKEFTILESYFNKNLGNIKIYIDDYVTYPGVMKNVLLVIDVLEIFQLIDVTNLSCTSCKVSTLMSFTKTFEDRETADLKVLNKAMNTVKEILGEYIKEEVDVAIMEELCCSSSLLTFVKATMEEDIRFLIDAVEEHSDHFVNESSVSDLIDIHRFLVPLIKLCQSHYENDCCCEPLPFFQKLVSLPLGERGKLAPKLKLCNTNINSLEGLYKSVANRGEVTKEIIANCLSIGIYEVSLKENGVCEAKMSYVKSNSSTWASYSLSELHDLRSRAHLIVSSADKHHTPNVSDEEQETDTSTKTDFTDFIEQVNLVTEITILFSLLWSSGYVKYRGKHWRKLKQLEELRDMKKDLQEELNNWEEAISAARQQFPFLNYYRSDQLCILYDFFTNRSSKQHEDVLSLINFIDQSITNEDLKKYQTAYPLVENDCISNRPDEILSIIGKGLEKIFENPTPVIRQIVDVADHFIASDLCVKTGELYVASLEEESLLTVNVLVTLYENTLNEYPKPNEMVFCDSQTTWEEIQLLLRRCFARNKFANRDGLFCIVNVEQLANEIQFQLIAAIKEKQYSVNESELSEENDYRLALICRGGDHHHMVEEFAQYSHHIPGMSDQALSKRLKSTWPEVKFVTSAFPGLGKSESIQQEVFEKGLNVVKFSISGPLDSRLLIKRLKELKVMKYHCLHLDISEVDDPFWLNTFLFQLILTGMVSSGTTLYHLPTRTIYVEIANTLNEQLRESLLILKYFARVDLKWSNYTNLVVSSEITNNLQVVCHYLNFHDRSLLESSDIHFTGPNKVEPLPAKRCRELLIKYYSSNQDVTFTALNTFLGILADQLLKFSRSAFFKVTNLKSMLETEAFGVRKNLFRALLEVSKEFASRSIKSPPSSSLEGYCQGEPALIKPTSTPTSGMTAEDMVKRVKGMIHWEESNHLLVVFQAADSQSIAAVYRDKSLVPVNVKSLLKSQKFRGNKEELEDFKLMDQNQLRKKLEQIACSKPPKKDTGNYALTPDNILKMILIILRVRAHVPVIIMGETGCGKTSLVRYLASNICQIHFSTFNFHAGITGSDIIEFIKKKDSEAKGMRKSREQIWVFLDEINTCDHLGLINEVICHHTLLSQPLSKNLVFIAACNPYKLRPTEHMKTAGLEGKDVADEYSRLVYRVHPLPEAMIDYVWDYGSLAENDEMAYIERMVEMLQPVHKNVFVKLLAKSQTFIRKAEHNHYSVSLRDVRRCILLVKWFMEMIEKQKKIPTNKEYPKSLNSYISLSNEYKNHPYIRSIVLALAHSYLSRLGTAELRKEYRQCMIEIFTEGNILMRAEKSVDSFSAIVRMEEEDFLARMELPPGTAKNTALRENVFVILVSILNRIPVFVVGKPGCSKSLSMQLIRSNLRGRDSKDALFQTLPQLYVVSFQGSESSTSEGILKVFEKASKYKSHNKDGNILPVVLLDEVGLAENSKYNPLKVLHSLLEPENGELPEVAVVGISNWALDAAKMNRATHLSRPEPTLLDLFETGQSLHYNHDEFEDNDENRFDLFGLAEGYFEYQSKQSHENFHGLRDYYSLIKSLSQCRSSDLQKITIALQRNFGGLPGELTNIQKIFLDKLKHEMVVEGNTIIPVKELIKKNLEDRRARHLMLITNGNSAVEILKQCLSDVEREVITIFGSQFEEDLTEDYNYRILSRIILCMERDCILILRDLERIYGSLYDMLNQNYAVVGKRKNCRVALGAYSNPMCHVNDRFRCVVLTDQNKVDYSDPPFLNRFEKQLLRFTDVLNDDQLECIDELDAWVDQMSEVRGLESQFKESDMFIGFHEDTVPSLVLLHSSDPDISSEHIVEQCKRDLMCIATPDGVLRAQKCKRLKVDQQEVKQLSESYFEKPVNDGLALFMETVVEDDDENLLQHNDEVGSKTIVMTYSTIHTDVAKCLDDTFDCQTERLGAYKSEKQLSERIKKFWDASDKNLLVLQCKPELDGEHMLLARSIIEDKRNSYKKFCQKQGNGERKHVCIVVHLQRGRRTISQPWQFSFLCGWKQVFLDVLDEPLVSLNDIRSESISGLLTSEIWPISKIAQNWLLWCFSCMKYTQHQRQFKNVLHIVRKFFESANVCQTIEELILKQMEINVTEENGKDEIENMETILWQVKVACDRAALVNSSTLLAAMENYIARMVCRPLAKIIYFLEKENAWPPHVLDASEDKDYEEYEDMWCDLVTQDVFFNCAKIPEVLGPGSYMLHGASLDLHVPFSQVVIKRIDALKDLILEENKRAKENDSNVDENGSLKPDVELKEIRHYSEIIINKVPEIEEYETYFRNSYMADLFDVMSAGFRVTLSRVQRVSIFKCAFLSHVRPNSLIKNDQKLFLAQLHLFVWLMKDQVLDQLRLVDCCQQFLPAHIVQNLIQEFLSGDDEQRLLTDDEDCSVEYEDKDNSSKVFLGKETNRSGEAFNNHQSDIDVDEVDKGITADELQDNLLTDEERESETDDESDERDESDTVQEQKCFEDVMVTILCEAMFPSQETVDEINGGVESWVRNATLLLSLAHKISHENPALHFLRLCVDFSEMAFVCPTNQYFYPLYILNEIAEDLKPDYLDHEKSFQSITENLIKPLEDQVQDKEEKRKTLQRFSSLFYGRCLDTNTDTSGAHLIIEQALSLDSADLVMIMCPVIIRLLLVEEYESPGIFIEIITNRNKIDNCPCLMNIDNVVKKLLEKELIHHDSYSAVMLCDLIQSVLKLSERYSIEDLDSSDCELLRVVRAATEVFYTSNGVNCGLILLSSAAFLRAFYMMLSNFIIEKANVTKIDGPYANVMGEITNLLTAGHSCRRLTLQMYFLKQLFHTGMSLFELRKFCQESEMLPAIKDVFVESKKIPKAVFQPSNESPEFKSVKDAYSKLVTEQDESTMLECITACQNAPNQRLAMMEILISEIFLKRAERKLNEKEENLVEWFSKHLDSLALPLANIFLRIIGLKDFDHAQLQLSPESSVDQVEIALLILHITCVFASGMESENSTLMQYILNPGECKQFYIIANGEERLHQTFRNREYSNCSSPIICVCGFRCAFRNNEVANVCPSCSNTCNDPNPSNVGDTTEKSASIGYSPQLPTAVPKSLTKLETRLEEGSEWDNCTSEMNPPVFRAMHLIVHACLFSGVAMGISSKENLSSLLNLRNHEIKKYSKHPEEFCLDHIKADLKCLMALLNCKKEIIFKLMHIAVEKCTHLITSLNSNMCLTTEQRLEWEQQFSSTVEDIFPTAVGSAKQLKEMIGKTSNKETKTEATVAERILELDDYPADPALQSQHLKRLCRVTREPSFQDFQATFLNSSNVPQEKHSFLLLFFVKIQDLFKVANLYHLLKWTRLVSSALTHRISRKVAETYSIDDFINGHLLKQENKSEEDVNNQKKLFDSFKQAWNNIVDLVNQELKGTAHEMPRLTNTSPIGYCLTESDSGVYLLKAIQILVTLQNSILDEVISLSVQTKHPALYFLQKNDNCSGIASISIQEANEKDIFNFHWSDEIFKYAQNNLDYGQGEEISYDFQQMEKILSNEVVFGKCHLTGTLSKFIFSKELFHSSSTMLTEIRELLPQNEMLPENVRQGLLRLKERRIHDVEKLLQHIESLIFLLKLRLRNATYTFGDISLEEFVKEWTTKLPSPFPVSLLPEPKSSIKLRHIAVLYEALEDLLADGAIEGLAKQYRHDITDREKDELNNLVSVKDGPVKLQVFLTALRRFVFRYLSSEKCLPEPNALLNSFLKEESLWSPAALPDPEIIQNKITVKYIYSVITHLQHLSKNRKSGKSLKGGRSASRTQLSKKGGRRSIKF